MKIPTVEDARYLGKTCGSTAVVIITLDHRLSYSVTTWGKTLRECRALAAWAEGDDAFAAIESIAGTMPSAGITDVALDPDASFSESARKDLLTEIRRIIHEPGADPALAVKIAEAMDAADSAAKHGE